MTDVKDEKKDLLVKVTGSMLPMEISKDLVKSLGELYNPIFSNIRIYGSVEDPLFVAKDVQKLLQLTTLSYSGDRFEDELEKRKIKIQTNGGAQETVVFTEQGLYKAIFASIVPVAKQFQRFITVVMRQLRTRGSVSIDQAIDGYKKEIVKEQQKAKMLEDQLDEEHAKMIAHRTAEERYHSQWLDMQYKAAAAEEKSKYSMTKDASIMEAQIQKMREKYMKPLYILLIQPPKEVAEEYTYEWESEEPNDDDCLVYALSLKEEKKTGQKVGTAYIHKETKLEDIHDKLHKMDLAVKKVGKVKDSYANAYETSIEEIIRIVDEMMML